MTQLLPIPATVLVALPWLLAFLTLFRLARRKPDLADVVPMESGPLVSIIVPARNESATIHTVVESILQSRYGSFEVLVVDDRSTDDTAAKVRHLAARDGRVRLVEGAELPAGWYGKPWACIQGYRQARGELLLFTDADTHHQPGLLPHAVAALQAERADLVTVAPRQRCVTFWERVVMPQVWLMLGLRFHPEQVNHARAAREVIANGQFILVTRDAYQAVGTHEAVGHFVAEDLALAQAMWRNGRRIFFAFADRLMETRMYHDLPHLIEGWAKNIYLGGRRSFPDEPVRRALVPATLALALLYWLIPPLVMTGVWSGTLPGWFEPGARLATASSALYWIVITAGMRIPGWYGLFYPLGAAMTLHIVARSIWRGASRVEWKGRVYQDVTG